MLKKKKINWDSLHQMFFDQAKENYIKPLLWFKKNKKYYPLTWKNVENKIKKISLEINKLGLKKGDKILIISENNPNWFIADFAIMSSGCVTVPAYTTYTKKDFEYIINDSEAKLAFISNENLFKTFMEAAKNKTQIKNIITFNKINYKDNEKKIKYIEEIYKNKNNINKFKISKQNKNHDACIIYTSGTSGKPKGVVLTHKSILSNLAGSIDVFFQ